MCNKYRFIWGTEPMVTLKVNSYQNYMTPTDWVNLLSKPLSENLISLDDWEFVSQVIEEYLERGKPQNFNFMACLNAFKKNNELDKNKEKGRLAPLYVQSDESDNEVENYEIYKHNDVNNLENTIIDNMCIDDAFAELQTINREIMIKYQVNLIKLLRRCLEFQNEYSEEFLTLKGLVKNLDETQREQLMIILSSGQTFC